MSIDEPTLKILLIGESGVGKTCLLVRYTDDFFQDSFAPTIGVDFKSKYIIVDGVKVKLQIWDTAGQEKFRSITKAYFRGAKGILIVFDLTQKESFTQTRNWINSIKEADDSITFILVGNKCDLTPVVTRQEIEEMTYKYNIQYFETSAKDNTNVEEAFNYLGKLSYQNAFNKSTTTTQNQSVNIKKSNDQKKSKKCNC